MGAEEVTNLGTDGARPGVAQEGGGNGLDAVHPDGEFAESALGNGDARELGLELGRHPGGDPLFGRSDRADTNFDGGQQCS
jgi:hypothetical protein